MARYSLFVLKVPLDPKQANKQLALFIKKAWKNVGEIAASSSTVLGRRSAWKIEPHRGTGSHLDRHAEDAVWAVRIQRGNDLEVVQKHWNP